MIARADLLETWGPGAHGSTYGGNPVACAAALATIDLLEGGLIDNAAARGDQALAGLRPLIDRFDGLVTDVRGKGLMLGVEFDTAEHAEAVQWACFERGLLVLECGKSSVRMSPALTVSEDEMTTALRIFAEAVAQVAGRRGLPRSWPTLTGQAAASRGRSGTVRTVGAAESGCHRGGNGAAAPDDADGRRGRLRLTDRDGQAAYVLLYRMSSIEIWSAFFTRALRATTPRSVILAR